MDSGLICVSLFTSEGVGIWIASILTLAIYSFLYRDNPIYRFSESLLIGISVGFLLVTTFDTTLLPKAFEPVGKGIIGISESGGINSFAIFVWILIPVVLGFLMFTRFVPRYAWMSRVALALYIGFGAGASIPANMQSYILRQIDATIRPFLNIDSFWSLVNALIVLVGLISTLFYFFFSKEQKGAFGKITRLGTFYLMIFFGATFGYTVMARISLLIGRLTFLMKDWLGLIS
ncbi:MAG: hypothetical protein JSW64_04100 [Candidatus Zixiibacteriota bacterium]|nr:MAG: hypothetical protein JSW64_04100 [candidate division Zixibacteria bacterium]